MAQAIWFGDPVQQVGKAEFLVQDPEKVVFAVGGSTRTRHARFIRVPVWTDRPIEDRERCVVRWAGRAPHIGLQIMSHGRDAQDIGRTQALLQTILNHSAVELSQTV